MNISVKDLKIDNWYIVDTFDNNISGKLVVKYVEKQVTTYYTHYLFHDREYGIIYHLSNSGIKNITKMTPKQVEIYLLLCDK